MGRVYIKTQDKHPEQTQVFLDGKEITADLLGYRIEQGVGQPPKLTIEYACYEQLTIEGEMEVHHICPRSARK